MAAGRVAWHVLWVYGALCMAVFTVRTIKRVIFHEARQYRESIHSMTLVLNEVCLHRCFVLQMLKIQIPAVQGWTAHCTTMCCWDWLCSSFRSCTTLASGLVLLSL
jgi:hypothetical protein